MLNLVLLNFVGLSSIMLLTKNKILSIKANKNMISKGILLLCILSLYIVINELNSININDYGYLRVVNILNIDLGYDGIGLIFLILTIYLGVISIISN
jgi:NADH:ubiquinone oxidoreductase subunit 4 (subunit M)